VIMSYVVTPSKIVQIAGEVRVKYAHVDTRWFYQIGSLILVAKLLKLLLNSENNKEIFQQFYYNVF
jgi:hypothetical protein